MTSKIGTPYRGGEVSYAVIFGVVEMKGLEPPKCIRHDLADELVVRATSCHAQKT